jgi:acyl-CoA synthetase (AMP-forming)/AMP-acid ligase II
MTMNAIDHLSGLATMPTTLIELLEMRAESNAVSQGYTFLADGKEKGSMTFAQLSRQARAIGAALQKHNMVGEKALLLYPSGLEFISAFFGCLYGGVIAVPVYPPNPARLDRTLPRLLSIMKDSMPKVVLTTKEILGIAQYLFSEDPDFQSLVWVATDELDNNIAADWQEPEISGNTIAFLQYTSGSTSIPKGVMVSHGNLLSNEEMIRKAFCQSERSVVISWLPLYHDMGLIGNVIQPLYVGGSCIFMSPTDFLHRPFRWLEAISRYRGTTSTGPNFAYDLCVRKISAEQRETLDLSSWQQALNGAEPVRKETLERFIEAFQPCGFKRETFYPCYGLAEATLLVAGARNAANVVMLNVDRNALEAHNIVVCPEEKEETVTLVGCGQLPPDQELVIVDPATLRECPPDKTGEIWVKNSSVALGYWNRPEETEYTFRSMLADSGRGPFLRTGDLGFIKDGELFITGRLKDLVVIRGENHYPQDIEWNVERSHNSLRQGCSAAFSIEINGSEQLAVCAEVERDSTDLDYHEVALAIRRAVAKYHFIHVYSVALLKAGNIPKTSSGKIQRNACRSGLLSGELETIEVITYHA